MKKRKKEKNLRSRLLRFFRKPKMKQLWVETEDEVCYFERMLLGSADKQPKTKNNTRRCNGASCSNCKKKSKKQPTTP